MPETHVHDCTGPDLTCPCGYVFRTPPISISIEVFDSQTPLLQQFFSFETVDGAIQSLRKAADRLERSALR